MFGEFEDEKQVDPRTDMIPLCSNCRRMIHRHGGTVEDLKALIST